LPGRPNARHHRRALDDPDLARSRFQDFQRSLPGLSPNTLSARLKTLEEHGIIGRKLYEEHPPRAEYLLTEKGRTLGPILKALLDWGKKHAP
jgi:DNA-binding HxlR family transcriptional regulator